MAFRCGYGDAMSEALERVIAEQQQEIDRLRKLQQSSLDAWRKNDRTLVDVSNYAFALIRAPTDRRYQMALKNALRDLGYCLFCEQRPCACDEEED